MADLFRYTNYIRENLRKKNLRQIFFNELLSSKLKTFTIIKTSPTWKDIFQLAFIMIRNLFKKILGLDLKSIYLMQYKLITMKKLVSVLIAISAFNLCAQVYVVTPDGLRDKDIADQSYLVIDVEGKTASQLYDNALKYVNATHKNPEYAIKGSVTGEYLKFTTYVPDFLIIEHMKANYDMNLSLTTELNFKDGRVKLEFIEIGMATDSGTKLLFMQEMVGVDIPIYTKKLELKKPEAKTAIETYFNGRVNELTDYLFERTASDKW